MRILIFSLVYYPRVGGAEIAIKEITDRIFPADCEFDMVTLRLDSNLPRYEKIGNVHVHRIGFSKKAPTDGELIRFPMYLLKVCYPPLAAFKAIRLHKERSYSAVWSMMSYMGFPAVIFLWWAPKVKLLLSLQEGDTFDHVVRRFRVRLVSLLYKRIFKRADRVQVISSYLMHFARAMGYQGPVDIIPNGVDVELFSKEISQDERHVYNEKVWKKEGDVLLITTSRLVKKNGISYVIDALSTLPAHVKFAIAGTGPLEDELRKQIEEKELSSRVILLGHVSHREIIKYLHIADIFIRPSLSEGMGNSFIEAMAASLPVIATPVGGIVDFLKDGETGLLVSPKENSEKTEDIIRKVEKLLKDKESRDYIVKNALAMVKERYDWKLLSAEMWTKFFSPRSN